GKMFLGGSRGPTNVPYPIPYRALTPKPGECDNLLVPICFSASHLGYASARMEPVFMICGESAGIAACRALAEKTSVQEINKAVYRAALEKAGQKLVWNPAQDIGPVAEPGYSMKHLLKECDSDGNKLVSQAEWEAAKKDWVWLFPIIDTDHDGRITEAEYKAFQEYKTKHADWQKLRPK
ncbi:MAG: FAD-dependent oxidoreductase, partial [Kiritimatiellaeota bacterium]|nr:FAD-dependent oxidoreductase [Kiritimatiellota bacterium]